MDIYKPKAERQKHNNRNARRPRGAVIRPQQNPQESILLRTRKSIFDFYKKLNRKTWLADSRILFVTFFMFFSLFSVKLIEEFKMNMPIEHVTVRGDFQQLDRSLLEETVAPLVGSNYFDLQVSQIKKSLHNFAWVQSVEVRKLWPNSVELVVVENKAIASWGEKSLVNEFGEIFTPEHINREILVGLPDLHGVKKQSELVLDTYAHLSEMSKDYGLKITSFSLVANRYWMVTLNDEIEVLLALDREEQAMLTFLKAWEKELQYSEQNLARVDMRYSNGFSVQFSDKLMSADINVEEHKQSVRKHHG